MITSSPVAWGTPMGPSVAPRLLHLSLSAANRFVQQALRVGFAKLSEITSRASKGQMGEKKMGEKKMKRRDAESPSHPLLPLVHLLFRHLLFF
jgi:hypothetical protein